MSLLGPADQARLRSEFEQLTRRVHLLFFTQSLDCDTCLQTRQILDELPPLSDQIVVDEVNFVLDADRARQYGIDRVPAIAVTHEATAQSPVEETPVGGPSLVDTRMRFLGAPSGYEFVSLVQAVRLAGGGESQLSPSSQARLAAVERPVTMQVFTTPT